MYYPWPVLFQYDPLGLVAPVVLSAKKLLQDLCGMKRGWDDSSSDYHGEKWEKWTSQLANLSLITVDRCVRTGLFWGLENCTIFERRVTNCIWSSHLSQISGCWRKDLMRVSNRKTRLSRQRPMTVPRLELSSAVLSVQLDRTVREELDIPINQWTFWPDSNCVLQYIRNQSESFQKFVPNRLPVIHENSVETCQFQTQPSG